MFKNASISANDRGLSAKQSKAGCLEVLPSTRYPSIRFATQETRCSGSVASNSN